jgi:hypothetical protein
MPIHIIKLCVGADSIEDLASWQAERIAEANAAGRVYRLHHRTRMFPKRKKEVIAGGSLYWVIKGLVQVRQPIRDLEAVTGADGIARCDIVLAPELILVRPVPRRPFQGWRYLDPADAPADLAANNTDGIADMPAHLRAKLTELGLL